MQKRIIIFDLFDTLLKVNQTNFKSGLYLLWEKHFIDACDFEAMVTYSDDLFHFMKDYQTKNNEFSFVDNFIPMCCDKFSIERFDIGIKEESEIVNAVSTCTLLPETIKLLNNLKKNGIQVYILSNSIFRSKALSEFIAQYGIASYITKLFTSTDFGLRKPSIKLFNMCVNEIKKTNTEIEKKAITFIGNSYKCDAIGGYCSGLDTIWLNVNMEDNVDDLPIRIINTLAEITF